MKQHSPFYLFFWALFNVQSRSKWQLQFTCCLQLPEALFAFGFCLLVWGGFCCFCLFIQQTCANIWIKLRQDTATSAAIEVEKVLNLLPKIALQTSFINFLEFILASSEDKWCWWSFLLYPPMHFSLPLLLIFVVYLWCTQLLSCLISIVYVFIPQPLT